MGSLLDDNHTELIVHIELFEYNDGNFILVKVCSLRENSHILNTLTATGSRSDYHSVVTADDRLLFKQNDNVEDTVNCSLCHNLIVSVVVRRLRMTS